MIGRFLAGVEFQVTHVRVGEHLGSDDLPGRKMTEWGGSRDQYCRECRCCKHYIPMRDREIWIFDWCYHEVETSEAVRQLASIFYMFREGEAPARA